MRIRRRCRLAPARAVRSRLGLSRVGGRWRHRRGRGRGGGRVAGRTAGAELQQALALVGDRGDQGQRGHGAVTAVRREHGQQALEPVALPGGELRQGPQRSQRLGVVEGARQQGAALAGLGVHVGEGLVHPLRDVPVEGGATEGEAAQLTKAGGGEVKVAAALLEVAVGGRQLEGLSGALDAVERIARQRLAAGHRDAAHGHQTGHRPRGHAEAPGCRPAGAPGDGWLRVGPRRSGLHGGDRQQPGAQRGAELRAGGGDRGKVHAGGREPSRESRAAPRTGRLGSVEHAGELVVPAAGPELGERLQGGQRTHSQSLRRRDRQPADPAAAGANEAGSAGVTGSRRE